MWLCRCDCGVEKRIAVASLNRGATTSCGCRNREIVSKLLTKEIAGQCFGRLVVIKTLGQRNKSGQILCECLCKCGRTHITDSCSLRAGRVQSCGCLRGDTLRELAAAGRRANTGISDKERADRRLVRGPSGLLLRRMSPVVFARDDYTCFSCGSRGGRLVAHHLMPYAEWPTLRTSYANLITMCNACHHFLHDNCGKDCDLEDFIDVFC